MENKGVDKNRIMMILILVLLVVLLGTIVGVSFYAMKILNAGAQAQQKPVEVSRLSVDEIDTVSMGDPISTNLKSTGDDKEHVARMSISVGIDNTDKKKSPATLQKVQDKIVVARDIALSTIMNTTYDDLMRPDGYDILKNQILAKLQETFNDNLIVEVYISDTYVQ